MIEFETDETTIRIDDTDAQKAAVFDRGGDVLQRSRGMGRGKRDAVRWPEPGCAGLPGRADRRGSQADGAPEIISFTRVDCA